MRLGLGLRKNRFQNVEQQLERQLTAQERKWLTLADGMMRLRPQPHIVSCNSVLSQDRRVAAPARRDKAFLAAP
jgi:hypothetical protein